MIQANLIAPGKIIVEETQIPPVGPDEVLIQVKACGICGSDIHAYEGTHPFISCPIVPGHEFSGIVSTIGEEVSNVAQRQRVTAEPLLVCGRCFNCASGRYNICDELRVIGCQSPGAMAEYIVVPADKVIPIPDAMSFEQAALVEPAAVAVHAVGRAGLRGAERVLVIGAGPIGLLTAGVAKAAGASEVLIADLVPSRLEVARKLGVDHVCNPSVEGLANALVRDFGSKKADVILECVGVESAILSAIDVARKGTRIVVVGVHGGRASIPLGLLTDRELELVGTQVYTRRDMERAIHLIESGGLVVEPLITGTFPLAAAAEAYEQNIQNRQENLKVLLKVPS